MLLNSCGPVQIWLLVNSPPNISLLLQSGINDQASHWSHGRRGSITPKEKTLYFCLLHLSLIFILLRRVQVSWSPFLAVHSCTLLVGLCVCVCACLSELLCFKASARGRKGVCYLCSRPLSGTEGLSGKRKGLLKECREGGNTLSPAACGKLLPMRRHSFTYDPFSSERKMRCGGILVSLRVSV